MFDPNERALLQLLVGGSEKRMGPYRKESSCGHRQLTRVSWARKFGYEWSLGRHHCTDSFSPISDRFEVMGDFFIDS
jgi:hypothetical protein